MTTSNADIRSQRARLCLEGLSIGDAFGQQFFYPGVLETCDPKCLPDPPWNYTDDTEMTISVVQTLEQIGVIDQDVLAASFADRFQIDPQRGYGAGARELLNGVVRGGDWRSLRHEMFGGSGSFGNGAAMRVAPIGAWFDDVDTVIEQATLSAEVTHTHPEGIAGAIGVALAAWWAKERTNAVQNMAPHEMLPWIISKLPKSEVRSRLESAATHDLETWPFTVAAEIGNGSEITAQDTVPFCLWMAAAHMDDYSQAMWVAARVGGDIDTNCAIIGGIVSLSVGMKGIPQKWQNYRERLNW